MKVFIFLISLFFMSCINTPQKQLLRIENSTEEKLVHNIPMLLDDRNMNWIYTDRIKSKIDKNDNVMNIDEFKMKKNTSYEIYKVKTEKGKRYTLELYSECDCFGFRKTLMIPVVLFIDGNGNLTKQYLEEYDEKDATLSRPVSMYYRWKIETDGSLLYIVVCSDNEYAGTRILKGTEFPVSTTSAALFHGMAGIALVCNYPFYASPFGKYELIFGDYVTEKKPSKFGIKPID